MSVRAVLAVAVFAVGLSSAHAAIYKCQEGGKTVFSDKPCATGSGNSGARIDDSPAISIGKRTSGGGGLTEGERKIVDDIDAKDAAQKAARARQAKTSSWILEGKVGVGMTPDEVKQSWGSPSRVNSHVGAYGRSEQWVYQRGGVTQYVYVENGAVTSVSTSQ